MLGHLRGEIGENRRYLTGECMGGNLGPRGPGPPGRRVGEKDPRSSMGGLGGPPGRGPRSRWGGGLRSRWGGGPGPANLVQVEVMACAG